MSIGPRREDSAEMAILSLEEIRLRNESMLVSMLEIAISAKTPRMFVTSMRTVVAISKMQAYARTRLLYIQMEALLDKIAKEAPRDRVWHPPMAIRSSKAAVRADHVRYMTMREQVLALFEETKFLQRSEPILAAQDSLKQAQSARASKPRKLQEHECNRIAKIYWQTKASDTGYGIVKELAREYEVSTTTIHNTVKKYKPVN
jgi:hypothetical protein